MSIWDDKTAASMPPPLEFPPGATTARPKAVVQLPKKSNGSHLPTIDDLVVPIGESVHALIERDIPLPARLCDPWATEGVHLIVGRPKLGKTTLMRQKMVAAALGGEYLDSTFPEPVKCAFLSLEEGELLCRSKFMEGGFPEAALASIQTFFEWPKGDLGVKLLDKYLNANPEVKYIVIDSLTRFRPLPDARMPQFLADYEAVSQLHQMAKCHRGVCIDVVHHARKARSEDALDDVSGTYGLTAACDSIIVLRSLGQGAVLYVFGRMWAREENQYSLKRSGHKTWDLIGVHLDLTDEQREALDHIIKSGVSGMSGKELGEVLGITQQSAYQRMDCLMEKGFVSKRFGRCYKK